ncbi:hypothetical protein SDC9_14694 [bioreactor metagenome]|uniref:Uncharacterized protein n=1 Tax=bioreactor metagenome TaxID=1076179 RepID=A0A644TTE4_9ZZZZ
MNPSQTVSRDLGALHSLLQKKGVLERLGYRIKKPKKMTQNKGIWYNM